MIDKFEASGGSGDSATLGEAHIELTLPASLSRALDAWIAAQLEPKPTREKAVLQILQEVLGTRFGS